MRTLNKYQSTANGSINDGVELPQPYEIAVVSYKVVPTQTQSIDESDPENPVIIFTDDHRVDLIVCTFSDSEHNNPLENDAIPNSKVSVLLGEEDQPEGKQKDIIHAIMISILDECCGEGNWTWLNP